MKQQAGGGGGDSIRRLEKVCMYVCAVLSFKPAGERGRQSD